MNEQVTWVDSGSIHAEGWETKENILLHNKIGTVTTVGIVMHEDDTTLYIALSYDPDNKHYFGVQAILKSCIQARVPLHVHP